MKKVTNIIGFLTALVIMVAAVFKINHFPGAGVALAIGGICLSIYFPVFIIDKMREKTGEKILPSHIVAAISACLIDLGVTCRLWHWQGAGILLTLGLAGFGLVFIPLLFIQKSKEAETDNIMNSAGALGLAALALGILFKLQQWPYAAVLLVAGSALLLLLYFPKFMLTHSVNPEIKHKKLRSSFFAIIIGALVTLYFIKSIEIHDSDKEKKATVPLMMIVDKYALADTAIAVNQ